jgi:hypothetical protein
MTMQFASEATVLLNMYVDSVRNALPLPPSARMAAADRLHQDISSACAEAAAAASKSQIDADIVRAQLAALGSPEECARRIGAAGVYGSTWQWPGDRVAQAFRDGRFTERMEEFARVAAEKGEHVARLSVEAAAAALDFAAGKLREAADELKNRTS